MTKLRPILVTICLVVAAGATGSVPTHARTAQMDDHQVCETPTRSMTLYAKELRDGRIGYGRTPKRVKVPGPTIQMTEGECLKVTLINLTDDRVSLHPHGVEYTVASDGTPHNKGCVRPGRQRNYVWRAGPPETRSDGTMDPGTAGYWTYHDHCRGTMHGTGGINKGLFGALIVRRPADPVPERRPFVVVMKDFTINLKRAPRTPTFRANLGERVEFVVIGHGDLFHTFHLHGHRWVDNRTGMLQTPSDPSAVIDNRTVGPADSFGFQIVAGEDVGPGAWMYHCHVQDHSDLGMAGIFLVREADGTVSERTRRALERWREAHRGH